MRIYTLQLGYQCNSNCLFCEIPQQLKEKVNPLFDKTLKELIKNKKKFDDLRITGGEPTIYPKILEIVNYAKKICKYKKIRLESNGFMYYYKEFVDKLVDSGVDHFQISFHTTDPQEYDKITGVKKSYKYVMKGIENIRAVKKPFGVNVVIHKYNFRQLPNIVETLVNKGVVSIQLSSLNPIGSHVKDGNAVAAITNKEVLPYIKKALDTAKRLKFDFIYTVNFPLCVIKELTKDKSDLIEEDKEPSPVMHIYKTKPEKCKKCSYFNTCDGMWKAYLEQFGDEEIKPIEGELVQDGSR